MNKIKESLVRKIKYYDSFFFERKAGKIKLTKDNYDKALKKGL